jgi:hypothetical protein
MMQRWCTMTSPSDLQGLLLQIAAAGFTPRLALCSAPHDSAIRYWHASIHNDASRQDFRYDSAEHMSDPFAAMAAAWERIKQPRPVHHSPVAKPPAVTLEDLGL